MLHSAAVDLQLALISRGAGDKTYIEARVLPTLQAAAGRPGIAAGLGVKSCRSSGAAPSPPSVTAAGPPSAPLQRIVQPEQNGLQIGGRSPGAAGRRSGAAGFPRQDASLHLQDLHRMLFWYRTFGQCGTGEICTMDGGTGGAGQPGRCRSKLWLVGGAALRYGSWDEGLVYKSSILTVH